VTSTAARPVYLEPQGVHLPRPGRAAVARRAGRVSGALAAELAPYVFERVTRRTRQRTLASALRRTCERLGATYVKFGQAVASSPAVLPAGIAEEFRSCLDQGPPVPWRQVRSVVENGLGRPIEAMFSDFERKPMAAASIAVVHKARLLDGTPVAVKVLRPGIGAVVATDLDLMEPFFRFLARQGIGEAGNAVAYVVGLRHQIAEELDLRNEVRTMDYFRTLFERFALDRLVIPGVYESLSSRRVLTMEFIEGGPIDDSLLVSEYEVDPRPLVRELLQAWVLTALGAGVFHADIHAGNLFLMPDGRLAMLDWGVVARLDEATKDLFTALVETALGREEAWNVVANHMMRSQGALLEEGFGATHADVLDMVRMYMEPILTKPLREVSMAAVFMSPEQARAMNHGEAMPQRSLREKWTQNRTMARAFRKAMDAGHFEEEMQRQTFLAAKQLLYLERYGRMYTPDEALLGDKEFLLRALELHGH
jgi:aarF domain-containing kinase